MGWPGYSLFFLLLPTEKLLVSASAASNSSSARHSPAIFSFWTLTGVLLCYETYARSTRRCGAMSTATWYPIPPYLIRWFLLEVQRFQRLLPVSELDFPWYAGLLLWMPLLQCCRFVFLTGVPLVLMILFINLSTIDTFDLRTDVYMSSMVWGPLFRPSRCSWPVPGLLLNFFQFPTVEYFEAHIITRYSLVSRFCPLPFLPGYVVHLGDFHRTPGCLPWIFRMDHRFLRLRFVVFIDESMARLQERMLWVVYRFDELNSYTLLIAELAVLLRFHFFYDDSLAWGAPPNGSP